MFITTIKYDLSCLTPLSLCTMLILYPFLNTVLLFGPLQRSCKSSIKHAQHEFLKYLAFGLKISCLT